MSGINSVYTVPRAVITMVLDRKGLPTGENISRESAAVVSKVGKTIATIENQWRRLMLTTDYGILNDLLSVRYQNNGQLKIVHREQRRSGDLDLVMPHRFVDAQFANAHLAKYLGWAKVTATENGLEMTATGETSNLRARALIAANSEARKELDDVAIRTGETPNLINETINLDGVRLTGVPLHRIYWFLYVAKSTSENLSAMMRLALRGAAKTVPEVKRHDTSASFERFLNARSTAAYITETSIENLPVPDFDFPAARTWGIEVEAAGARGVQSPADDWDRRGDGSLRSAYSGHNRSAEDCPDHDHNEEIYTPGEGYSENPDYEDPDYCDWLNYDYDDYDDDYGDTAEFVSPILRTGGSADLKVLLSDLIEQPQNNSAGIHIHVGAEDLSPKQVGGLVFAYQMIEPIITEAYRREERGYCRPRAADSVIAVLKSSQKPGARKSHRDNGSGEVIRHGDRYLSLNLCALEAHGTVEFRAMGPVYEYDHLIKWALFCRELVSMAKADVPAKVWSRIKDWSQLASAIQKYGTELKQITVAALEEQFTKSEELIEA